MLALFGLFTLLHKPVCFWFHFGFPLLPYPRQRTLSRTAAAAAVVNVLDVSGVTRTETLEGGRDQGALLLRYRAATWPLLHCR